MHSHLYLAVLIACAVDQIAFGMESEFFPMHQTESPTERDEQEAAYHRFAPKEGEEFIHVATNDWIVYRLSLRLLRHLRTIKTALNDDLMQHDKNHPFPLNLTWQRLQDLLPFLDSVDQLEDTSQLIKSNSESSELLTKQDDLLKQLFTFCKERAKPDTIAELIYISNYYNIPHLFTMLVGVAMHMETKPSGKIPRSLINSFSGQPIHWAARNGYVSLLREMCTKSNNDVRDEHMLSPLHHACQEGHERVVRYLIEDQLVDVDSIGTSIPAEKNTWFRRLLFGPPECKNAGTGLHYAAVRGHALMIQYLLTKGANPNSQDDRGKTPLHKIVAKKGCLATLRLLCNNNADPHCTDNDSNTLLHIACRAGDEEVIEFLLQLGLDSKLQTKKRKLTALHIASAKGFVNCLKALLRTDCAIDALADDCKPATYFACINGDLRSFQELITSGANQLCVLNDISLNNAELSNIVCALGKDATFLSTETTNKPKVLSCDNFSLLLHTRLSSLHLAALKGHLGLVRYLIEDLQIDPTLYALVDRKIRKTNSKVDEAFISATSDEAFVSPSSPIFDRDTPRRRNPQPRAKIATPLYLACKKGHVDVVEYLLSCLEIDINAGKIVCGDSDSELTQSSPLELVCKKANHELIKLLSLHGASAHNIKNLDVIIENSEIPK